MSPRERSRLYSAALLAPVERVADSAPWARAWAVALFIAQAFARADLFVLVWFVLAAATTVDYAAGSIRARIEDRHDEDVARARLLGKAIALSTLVLLRVTEALALRLGVDTGGAAASAIAFLLLLSELGSLNRHKAELTGRPIPWLGPLLDWMEQIAARMLPGTPPPPPPLAPEIEP